MDGREPGLGVGVFTPSGWDAPGLLDLRPLDKVENNPESKG